MTATQKLKRDILYILYDKKTIATEEDVDRLYDEASNGEDCDGISDLENEFRSGEYETGLQTEYSRHYESKAVAMDMLDGTSVGWTYWYGGGKHGEPESIDWMSEAYDVEFTEVMQPVRTWKKKGAKKPRKKKEIQ